MSWTVRYEASTLPAAVDPVWVKTGTDDEEISDGKLHTTVESAETGNYYTRSAELDHKVGVAVKFRHKIIQDSQNDSNLLVQGVHLVVYNETDNESTSFYLLMNEHTVALTTGIDEAGVLEDFSADTTDYNIYEIKVDDDYIYVYMNGVEKIKYARFTDGSPDSSSLVEFGCFTTGVGDNLQVYLDYLYYKTSVAAAPTFGFYKTTYTINKIIELCAVRTGDPAYRIIQYNEWKSLLEQVYFEILYRKVQWKFLQRHQSFDLVASQQEYASLELEESSPTEVKLENILQLSLVDNTTTVNMDKIAMKHFLASHIANTNTDVPKLWAVGCKSSEAFPKLWLTPIPDSNYTCWFSYLLEPTLSTSTDDVTQIPDKYIYTLVYGILAYKIGKDYFALFQNKLKEMIEQEEFDNETMGMYLDPSVYY